MRLTLRTLLAYLDGVLDRQDASVMETKLSESENARRLAERIHDVTSREQIEPLRVDARTESGDANAMADYLDGTMPTNQVPPHELACLDSDALLAEASASHQILSRVVREPAKVSQRVRARLAKQALDELEQMPVSPPPVLKPARKATLPANFRQDQSHAEPPQGAPADSSAMERSALRATATDRTESRASDRSVPAPPSFSSARQQQDLDALHEDSRRSIGSESRPTYVDSAHTESQTHRAGNRSAASSDASLMPSPYDPQLEDRNWLTVPAVVASISVALLIALIVLSSRGDLQRWLQPAASDQIADASEASESTALNNEQRSADASTNIGLLDREPSNRSTASSTDNRLASSADSRWPTRALNANTGAGSTPQLSDRSPTSQVADVGTPAGASVSARGSGNSTIEPPAASAAPLAESVTWTRDASGGLALYFAPDASDWSFLEAHDRLEADGFIQSMPVDRLTVQASTGLVMELIGASQVGLLNSPSRRSSLLSPAIELKYGRLILGHVSANQRCELQLGSRTWTIDFNAPGSSLAIERRPWLHWGEAWSESASESDPPRHELIEFHVMSGEINLSDGSATRTLRAPIVLQWVDGVAYGEGLPAETTELWFPLDGMDLAAQEATQQKLDPAANPVAAWRSLLADRDPAVRATAFECLTEIGLYEGVWEMLSDTQLPTIWRSRLRASIVNQLRRGEGRAARFLQAAPSQSAGETAIELLAGYTDEQLIGGADRRLVEQLESPDLLIRTLAIEQLIAITGQSELFVPDADPTRRARSVAQWRSLLEAKQIRYASDSTSGALPLAPLH